MFIGFIATDEEKENSRTQRSGNFDTLAAVTGEGVKPIAGSKP